MDPDGAKQKISDAIVTGVHRFRDSRKLSEHVSRIFFRTTIFLSSNQLMDVTMDQINQAIRNDLESQIEGADDGTFQSLKSLGAASQSLFSAKIRGSPTFDGDSLRKIHLDAAFKMNMPEPLNFNAYMEIDELTSANTPIGCIPPGPPAAAGSLHSLAPNMCRCNGAA